MFVFYFIKIKLLNFDPLEQFEATNLVHSLLNVSWSNIALYNILGGIVMIFIYMVNKGHWPYRRQSIISWFATQLHEFVDNIVDESINLPHYFVYPAIFFLFLYTLAMNLCGMIPYSYTVTSSFVVTVFLSTTHFFCMNILIIYRSGFLPFFRIFVPGGTPTFVSTILFIIEFVSYYSRVLSLAIRLLANMMAGHTLLKILVGFVFSSLYSLSPYVPFAIFPVLVVLFVFVLEILISMLQAYVLIILICIYYQDVVVS